MPTAVNTLATLTIAKSTLEGDYNGDGRITKLDVLVALKMSIGLLKEDLIMDMDKDGRVTADDARLLIIKMATSM